MRAAIKKQALEEVADEVTGIMKKYPETRPA